MVLKEKQTIRPKFRVLEEHASDSVKIMWNVDVKVRREMEVRRLEVEIWQLFAWKRVSKLYE